MISMAVAVRWFATIEVLLCEFMCSRVLLDSLAVCCASDVLA